MALPFRICLLGYRQLTALAQQVITSLSYEDTEVTVEECVPDRLPQIVDDAMARGVEVFIAGGSNATAFRRYARSHLQEIAVRDVDYLIAIQKARAFGEKIGIARYIYSRELNAELLSSLSGAQVTLLDYEETAELHELIRDSDCDAFIGAALTVEIAGQYEKNAILVYSGEETIKRSVVRARALASELRKEQKSEALNRALTRNSPLGIIVTDEEGRITSMNLLARNYVGFSGTISHGKFLSDIAPNLDPSYLIKKKQMQHESFRILDGVRLRCLQTRLQAKGMECGTLTTLRIDNTLPVKKSVDTPAYRAYRWDDMISFSPSMKRAIQLGKKYADMTLPVALFGDVSAHKQMFAESMHSGSTRSAQPLISINLSSIPEQTAGRYLLGSVDSAYPHAGILQAATGGTLILSNVQHASPAVQDLLLDVLANWRFTPIGALTPVTADIRFITIFNAPFSDADIRSDLLQRLCTLRIDLPVLRERPEDILPMFETYYTEHSGEPLHLKRFQKAADTLLYYHWPGNASELETCAGRFHAFMPEQTRLTGHIAHQLMVRAIGEDALFACIQAKHPCLAEEKPDTEDLKRAISDMKYYLDDNNEKVAARLGISRTSLWRLIG